MTVRFVMPTSEDWLTEDELNRVDEDAIMGEKLDSTDVVLLVAEVRVRRMCDHDEPDVRSMNVRDDALEEAALFVLSSAYERADKYRYARMIRALKTGKSSHE